MAWQNQINTLPKLEAPQDWETGRLYLRARDDFAEPASFTAALGSVISSDSSAISAMMDNAIDIVKKNNQLQSEGLKNPKNAGEKQH